MRISSPFLVAVALLLPAFRGDADGFTPITLTSPPAHALIHPSTPNEKVAFGAFANVWSTNIDWPSVGGPWVRLTIWAKGGQSIVREPNPKLLPLVSESVTAGELLALSRNNPTADAFEFQWKLEVGTQQYKDGKKSWLSTASSEFSIAGPANLALSVDGDYGSPWPKTIVVRNTGASRSQPSSLEVDFRLRDTSNSDVRGNCASLDYHKVHTVLALGPNEKSGFELPQPSNRTPTKAPGGGRWVVTCNYSLDAVLVGETNKLDPSPKNNRIQKTVSVDITVN